MLLTFFEYSFRSGNLAFIKFELSDVRAKHLLNHVEFALLFFAVTQRVVHILVKMLAWADVVAQEFLVCIDLHHDFAVSEEQVVASGSILERSRVHVHKLLQVNWIGNP